MHRAGYVLAAVAGALMLFGCKEEEPPPSWVWMAPRPIEAVDDAPPTPKVDVAAGAIDDEPAPPDEPETPEAYEVRLETWRQAGRKEAAESIAAGHPELLAGGMPGRGRMFYSELLREEMGVELRNTGCMMSMESSALHSANNDAVTAWIAERFGPNALENLQTRAEALSERYRGREREWEAERHTKRLQEQTARARSRR